MEELLFKIPFKKIEWRVGNFSKDKTKALALGYIDSRDLMQRLDDVVGSFGWSTYDKKEGDTYYCQLTISGCTKTGAAGATSMEAEKGGSSDAFKRAGYLYGIGRYLYNLSDHKTWVTLNDWKQIDDSAENMATLNKALIAISGKAYREVIDMATTKSQLEKLTNHKIFVDSLGLFNDSGKAKIMEIVSKRLIELTPASTGFDGTN